MVTDISDELVDLVEKVLEKKYKIELDTKDLDEIRDTLDAVIDKHNEG